MEKQINQLLECANPIFHIAARFHNKERGADLPENLSDEITQAFSQLEKKAFALKIMQGQLQIAKYALAAFIDEIILSSAWQGRNAWMGKPLQLEFFGEHLAGEGFFRHLQELRQNPQQNVDVLEVYYVCLQLGFEGMYRWKGSEHLAALQSDLRNQIALLQGTLDPKLSPQGLPQQTVITKVGARLPYWVIGSVTTAIIFFIYLGYAIAINHQANHALEKITINKNNLLEELKRF